VIDKAIQQWQQIPLEQRMMPDARGGDYDPVERMETIKLKNAVETQQLREKDAAKAAQDKTTQERRSDPRGFSGLR
jgi:uncharacterized ParB-like nuclease family protein